MRCDKCGCIIYGLGDDYYCPLCENLFCYECIEEHGCKVKTITIDNKDNYVIRDE